MAKQDMNKDADSYSETETHATKIWRTIQISRCKIESLLKVLVKITGPRHYNQWRSLTDNLGRAKQKFKEENNRDHWNWT
jgi:hypothetical protein